MSEDFAVACAGVRKTYATTTGSVVALDGVDARFPAGGLSVVVGPTGSGKSSLLRILACFDRPDQGTVEVAGTTVSALGSGARRRLRRRRIGYVFQRPSANLLPYLSAAEHLVLAAQLRGGAAAGAADELLRRLGLAGRAGHRPAELSSGEQQRLAFAAAVVGRPAVVVADEPTAELDADAGRGLLQSVLELRGQRTTLVVCSHDPAVVAVADHVLRLDHGRVVPS